MKKSILKSISDYIKSRKDHFTSEDIESNKIPVFLVYTAMSNNRENLNLYFDYKTSKQYINRAIFSLGEYEDFSEKDKKEIIKTAILSLKKLGIKAHPTKSDYQGSGYKKNPESKKCIFQTPDQMREFLNKHLKDRWSWRKNEIVVQTGQGTWAIARKVEDFFNIAGFGGAGSEMDNIGNVVVRAYVPKSIMALKDKE